MSIKKFIEEKIKLDGKCEIEHIFYSRIDNEDELKTIILFLPNDNELKINIDRFNIFISKNVNGWIATISEKSNPEEIKIKSNSNINSFMLELNKLLENIL